MKAVVFHGIGEIALDDVPEPKIKDATDAIVRLTVSAICGTDLHMVRGTFPGMKPGTVLGHEGVGIVEEIGKDVRNLEVGDRVVIPSTIACGACAYCRTGYYSQCDVANPKGPQAGTCFFGGPAASGPIDGLQAEFARIPFANVGLVKLPDEIDDDQAILLSDIFPTAYFGAKLAEIKGGDTVAVFGCGPVGQFSIASARLCGAGRIFAIDNIPTRLQMARDQGAEVINFDEDDPVEALRRLTNGIGVDRAIEAVGVDANTAHHGPASRRPQERQREFTHEREQLGLGAEPSGDNWHPGDAPSQALAWAAEGLAKAGTLAIIGVYPPSAYFFPLGFAMNRNLTVRMGNCNHRKYIPRLVDLVEAGVVNPADILSHQEPITSAIDAYRAFDARKPGWLKVELEMGRRVVEKAA